MTGEAAKSLAGSVPAVGDVIAQKYRVESVVGRGGMGVVVAARHVQLGHAVAIKLLTLPPDEDRRDEAIARFLNEARAAARLQSDHVVRIHDVGQLDNGLPFMVMELLVGSDLSSLLEKRGQLPEAEAADYVLQACAGVAEAHQLGIVHRDLKPSNLFVTQRSDGLPRLVVLDFGISKQLADPSSGEHQPTFTSTRTLMGSPNYMSPEQIRDARRVDARADVWALGIILQELLTNAPVFHGESFPGVCAAIVADPPLAVRTLRPDVSERLEAIIARCLQKDASKRYQSVAELAAELAPLGARATISGSGPQALVYSSQQRLVPSAQSPSAKSAPADDLTVPMPSGTDGTYHGRDGTLESARLPARVGPGPGPAQNTHSAVSAPDSRIEVREVPTHAAARSAMVARWLLPAGLALLLLGGVAWWKAGSSATAPADSSDGRAPSAPTLVPDAPFTLSLDSQPPGATVSEGSTKLGTTPLALELRVTESSGPRVLVLEKEGFEPYVLRQAAAAGLVRQQAILVPKSGATPPASATAAPEPLPSAKPRLAPPGPKRVPTSSTGSPTSKPPSDIRLER